LGERATEWVKLVSAFNIHLLGRAEDMCDRTIEDLNINAVVEIDAEDMFVIKGLYSP
jgi:hypothetical protein